MIEWKEFSPKALDFIENSTARLCILHGAVRSSKTINCTVRWLLYLKNSPPGDLCMMGRTMATLQRNVLNDLFDIVGPDNYHWVNRQQGEVQIYGRRIYCFGANNEDAESKIRGATFAGALCDEVTLYPKSVFNQLMARLSVKGAQCFCNTNPDSPYHWFYTDYITNDKIQNKQIWTFYMEDNKSLDPEYIEALKQEYTGVWYERMIESKWVAAEGSIYDMFDAKIHLVDTQKKLQEWIDSGIHPNAITYLVGCEYATSTVMTWSLIAVSPDFKYLKLREYYYDAVDKKMQKTDSEFAAEFIKWLNGLFPEIIYCDPSAASWKLELMRRGYNVQNANNDVINGIRTVSTALQNGSYYIDKSCSNTAKEYSSYAWDPNAQAKGLDKPIKAHDHTCDADRYVIHTWSLQGLAGVYD